MTVGVAVTVGTAVRVEGVIVGHEGNCRDWRNRTNVITDVINRSFE